MFSEGEVREEMSKGSEMDKVKVFLRVKPVTENESEIIEIEDNQTVTISCHKTTREGGFRWAENILYNLMKQRFF